MPAIAGALSRHGRGQVFFASKPPYVVRIRLSSTSGENARHAGVEAVLGFSAEKPCCFLMFVLAWIQSGAE